MTWLIKSKPGCPWCVKAQELIASMGDSFDEKSHETPEEIAAFKEEGHSTFPQIYHNGALIGGFSDLKIYVSSGLFPADDF
jgi:glutaredoxin